MTKFGVAHEQLTVPEESKNEQIANQIFANLMFVLCIAGLCIEKPTLCTGFRQVFT
jgi:hypothetical protein